MSEWTKFTDKWPPLDIPINTRFELRDEVPQKPWIMRYLPKKQPLKCEYKFEVIDKGKKTLIGVYEDIIDHMEWRIAND